jgi:starvation-inducible DNA-binding protein
VADKQSTPARPERSRDISQSNDPKSPVVQHLQRQLANGLLLYSNYKRYHWQTYGPLFRDLHLVFDEFADEVLETVDPIAERLRMIGQDPVAGPHEVLKTASIHPAELAQTMREMVAEADEHLLTVIREMRDGVRAAEDADDPGTVDLLSRYVQIHEKHEWWLRELLERGDRLVN